MTRRTMANHSEKLPTFLMWRSISQSEDLGWQRRWFDSKLDPGAVFNIRGIGIREPMFNPNVYRPIGTGDWLLMFFHRATRLKRYNAKPSVGPKTLILWPPGAEQFYSWGESANIEPHSWMHVEGTWVEKQIKENRLPTSVPLTLNSESLMTDSLQFLLDEMTQNETADPIILQNLFQNWEILSDAFRQRF